MFSEKMFDPARDSERSVVCYNSEINEQCADTRHDYHAASLWQLQGSWIVQITTSALC